MYVENEEELERLCLEEPEPMLRAQMDILTHRINHLAAGSAASSNKAHRRRSANSNSDGSDGSPARSVAAREGFIGMSSAAAMQRLTEENDLLGIPELTPSESLSAAMGKHDEWKKSRNNVQQQAATSSAKWWKAEQAVSSTSLVPSLADKNAELLAQLRAERERLASLLPLFDARIRKQQRQEEQKSVDFVESMQEARRAAEAEHLQEMRERRRLEEDRQRREEEQRQRRQEAQEAERQRREDEDRHRAAEEQRRREIARRVMEQEDRTRAEMEENEQRRRRDEEQRHAEEARRKQEQRQQEEEHERTRKAEEAGHASRRANNRAQALDLLCDGRGETELVAEGAGARDFLHRALAALGTADDASSSDEGEGGGEDGHGGDLQLLQASETIAAHIERAAAARGRPS